MRVPMLIKKYRLGMEISPAGIYLARLMVRRQAYVLEEVATMVAPQGLSPAEGGQWWLFLQEQLANYVESMACRDIQVMISIPYEMTRMACVQLPASLDKKEIDAEIQMQVRHELLGGVEDIAVDYKVLPRKRREDMKVLYAAIRRSYLNRYVNLVREAGLAVCAVDIDACSIMRLANTVLAKTASQSMTADNAALLLTKRKFRLIIFNNGLIKKYVALERGGDFGEQCRQILAIMKSTSSLRMIKLVVIADENENLHMLEVAEEVQVLRVNPSYFFLNHHLLNTENYLVACGVAMRKANACMS